MEIHKMNLEDKFDWINATFMTNPGGIDCTFQW